MNCYVCGYVYETSTDEENGGDTRKPFELPEDWRCPLCGSTKDYMIAEEEEMEG